MSDVEKLTGMAYSYGWDFLDFQENQKMLSFVKSDNRINIYLSRMTVGISTKGKKQLFRRFVNFYQMEKIFKYPRRDPFKE